MDLIGLFNGDVEIFPSEISLPVAESCTDDNFSHPTHEWILDNAAASSSRHQRYGYQSRWSCVQLIKT